jgi:hypothetical protein
VLTKTMRERADAAFGAEPTQAFSEKYLDMLYANWFETMRAARRALLLATLLALAFFLLEHAKTGTIKIGPLETHNIVSVLTLIPAIASFLIFEALNLTFSAVYFREASGAVFHKLHPKIYENDLEVLLEPTSTFAWGMGSNVIEYFFDGSHRLVQAHEKLTTAAIVTTWIAAIAFFVYAYVTLFEGHHGSYILLIASLLFTIFNLLRAILQALVVNEAMDDGFRI